ncbi:MAG: SDR family oxidoreductase [Fimbriimonadales bacterium]
MKHVAVAGAAGFLGRCVVDRLLADGFAVTAIVRGEPPCWLTRSRVTTAKADIGNARSLQAAFEGAQAAINLVAIIKEGLRGATFDNVIAQGTRNFVEAANDVGLEKIVYVSAMGTSAKTGSKYFEAKWKAEEAVRSSTLNHTILRPSIILGPGDGSSTFSRASRCRFPEAARISQSTSKTSPQLFEVV